MIASLRGTVLSNSNGVVVLEVGGVGYAVSIISKFKNSLTVGEQAFLHTAFIVREDAHLLFGFETADELMVFDLLRSVTGVGPKSAQAVLGAMTLSEIASAVITDNDAAFKRVSGIGPKTAKLITLSLAGKLGKPGQPLVVGGAETAAESNVDSNANQKAVFEARSAVIEALLGLGYPEKTATAIVEEVALELNTSNRNELLRASLGRLGTSKAIAGGSDR